MFSCFDNVRTQGIKMIGAARMGNYDRIELYYKEKRPGAITEDVLIDSLKAASAAGHYRIVVYLYEICITAKLPISKHINSLILETTSCETACFLLRCESTDPSIDNDAMYMTAINRHWNMMLSILIADSRTNPAGIFGQVCETLSKPEYTTEERTYIISLFLSYPTVSPATLLHSIANYPPPSFLACVNILIACQRFKIQQYGPALLFSAMKIQSAAGVSLLLEIGITPSIQDFKYCITERPAYLKDLLGCKRGSPDAEECALLMFAMKFWSANEVQLILAAGIAPSIQDFKYCITERPAYLIYLLKYKQADPCAENCILLGQATGTALLQLLDDERIASCITPAIIRLYMRPGESDKIDILLKYILLKSREQFNMADVISPEIAQFLVFNKRFTTIANILAYNNGIECIPQHLRQLLLTDCAAGGWWPLFQDLWNRDVRPTDEYVRNIVMAAITSNQADILQLILDNITDLFTLRLVLSYAVDNNNSLLVQLVVHKDLLHETSDLKRIMEWVCRHGVMALLPDLLNALSEEKAIIQDCFQWSCICNQGACVDYMMTHPAIDPSYNNNVALVHSIRRGLIPIVGKLMRDVRVSTVVGRNVQISTSARNAPTGVRQILNAEPRIAGIATASAPHVTVLNDAVCNPATIAYTLWTTMCIMEEPVMLPEDEILEEAVTQDNIVSGEYLIINDERRHIYAVDFIRGLLNSHPFDPTDPFTRNKIVKLTKITCIAPIRIPGATAPIAE
jgi:hypothetical protein